MCWRPTAAALERVRAVCSDVPDVVPIRRRELMFGWWVWRNVALLEGLKQGHDAGWVGGKGRAKEDRSTLLWCAW